MFFRFLTNTLTSVAIIYHTYQFYKDKKLNRSNKHSIYVFMLLSIILTIEQNFSFVFYLLPFASLIKFILVFTIALPYTNMAPRIYRGYVARVFDDYQDVIDACFIKFHLGTRNKVMEFVERFFETFKSAEKRDIVLKQIEMDLKVEEDVDRLNSGILDTVVEEN